ncbi:MAG: hypothetical protein RR280_04390 [Bacteroidaceae bacterium]
MAVNKAKSATTPAEKAAEIPTTLVYLAIGLSFTHRGTRFVPDVVYQVEEPLGDFLLGLESSIGVSTFEEAGKKHSKLPVQVVTSSGVTSSGGAVEIGGHDDELQKHFDAANLVDPEGGTGDGTEGGDGKVLTIE